MTILLAAGIEAIDVTLVGGEPVGISTIDLRPGLSVFYGQNGAGKSRLLDGIWSALNGVQRSAGEALVRCQVTPLHGGWDSELIKAIAQLARESLGNKEEARQWIEDAYDDPDIDEEESHEIAGRQLFRDLRAIAATSSTEHLDTFDPHLLMEATGTIERPTWDVYISGSVPDLVPWAPFIDTEFDDDVLPFLDLFLRDIIRFGRSGRLGPIRLTRLGQIDAARRTRCLRAEGSTDVDRMTSDFVSTRCRDDAGRPDLIEQADYEDVWLSDRAVDEIKNLQSRASDLCGQLLGVDLAVRFSVNHPNEWLLEGLGRWMARDAFGIEIAVTDLGSAWKRWATLAIELAVRAGDTIVPATVVIDEPENALHPAAQHALAEGLTFTPYYFPPTPLHQSKRLGDVDIDAVIVATHSPVLMRALHAHVAHVRREPDGHAIVDWVTSTDDLDRDAEALGLTRADLLLMTRTFLFVEGIHDRVVFGELFGKEFNERRVRVIQMDSASKLSAVFDSEFLFRFSSARLVVVLDRGGEELTSLWKEFAAAAADDRVEGERMLSELARRSGGSNEAKWLAQAGRVALKHCRLDRISLVALVRPDILDYLPVENFVSGASSWNALRAEREASPRREKDFKSWLAENYGLRIDADLIRSAVKAMDSLGDLPRVLDNI